MRGIDAVTEQGRYEAVPRLKELLDDDSPLLFDDDGYIAEIRAYALSALQQLHYRVKHPLELDPVAVRRAMPLAEMRAAYADAIASLSEAERREVVARADEVLRHRVQPRAEQVDDVRAYRVLQELGRVSYERQRPDPHTTLTPLQETIYASQVVSTRPRPCLRVGFLEHPEKTLGWIYRNPRNNIWAGDFSAHPVAKEASEALTWILTLKNGIPRVVHDVTGRPVHSADGKLVFDGDLSRDTGDVVECLRSIAALMHEFTTELFLPEATSSLTAGARTDSQVEPLTDRLARAYLSLEGLSVGDAFGETFLRAPGAVQFLVPRQTLPPPWPWTDDTQMALSMVEVLAEHGTIDQTALAQRFAERYEPHRGYGAGAHRLLQEIRGGQPWAQVSRSLFGGQGSFGNGSAMRVAPLGAYFAHEPDRILEEAARSAEVTHAHPEGIAGAAAVALAAALVWQSRGHALDPGSFLDEIVERLPASATRDGIARARALDPSTGAFEAGRVLGNGSRVSASDTVPLCLWIIAHRADSYPDALWAVASALGDIDTTCAIVGGVLALRAGLDGIPRPWRDARESLPAGPWRDAT